MLSTQIKATAKSIGKQAILADYSYNKNLDTEQIGALNTEKEFIILSKPYKEIIKSEHHRRKAICREFVNVCCGNHVYRVLNCFKLII